MLYEGELTALKQYGRRPPDCSNENSRICSCHFIGGVKAAGPSLFKWNRERLSHLQAAERGVKEEPEEKDIVSPQGGPGRPTDDRSLLKAAVDSAHAGQTGSVLRTHTMAYPFADLHSDPEHLACLWSLEVPEGFLEVPGGPGAVLWFLSARGGGAWFLEVQVHSLLMSRLRSTGDEVLEDAMAHFKEEETESETKSDAEAEADSSGNLRDC
ncbi:uncharacterized protein [Salminus brasiliensis]|uniref:uncharacterized protein isoform X2 n=1 Tax=Salminus brasiliensis TaxID=930266 RepID=UPI003B82F40C